MSEPAARPVVYIHTDDRQLFAAEVGAHSLRLRSVHPDAFEVRLLRLEETPQLLAREGQRYVWNDGVRVWSRGEYQAFMPLRRLVPQLMGFRGRALVLDPDIFAVGDVFELLRRDMGGKAILCRTRHDIYQNRSRRICASSVMLLDCARLTHWRWDRDLDDIFNGTMDFGIWIGLLTEPPETVGALETAWNHFDTLNERTKLLHNTEKSTQPWKTGLPVDFDMDLDATAEPQRHGLRARVRRALGIGGARPAPGRVYLPHPDPRQERLFFSLLNSAIENGAITEQFLRDEIARRHVRADAFALLRAARAGLG